MITALKPVSSAKIGQNIWDLDAVIPKFHKVSERYFIQAPTGVAENFRQLLSRDVFSEGDSQVFFDYVVSRKGEMSDDFLRMLARWLDDELKHYEGLRRVYYSLSDVSYEMMTRIASERVHEMTPIQMLLADEFTMLVALMFDEIGSVYSYRRDLREYYAYFGPEVHRMGHQLVKDEGMHFSNAAELLLKHHTHRFGEIQTLLEDISRLEKTLTKYHNTFFLDHAQEKHRFPPYFNQVIVRVILARLGLGNRPPQNELRSLWQWVPAGYQRVPVCV